MERPNILILYTDQQRADALGAAGNPEVETPNLDRLAARGLRFERSYVQHPLCMPSRVSFLTGQYPSQLRITHMGVPVPPETATLPRLLKGYGYHCANIGKLHFLPHACRDHRDTHPDYGFDHLEISDEPGCYEDAYRAWVRRKAPEWLDHVSVGLPPATAAWQRQMDVRDGIAHPEEREPRTDPFPAPAEYTHSAFVAEQTIEYLRGRARRGGVPFLCVAGFYSPHAPWVVPQQYLDRYDPARLSLPDYPPEVGAEERRGHFSDDFLRRARQGYFAMVTEVDHHVGRVLDALEETGQAENTVVVFTSDHGEWLGEFLRYGKGFPGQESVSRVPLLLRYPRGVDAPGRAVAGMTEAVDVVPTLLEWAGIPRPGHLGGRPLPTEPGAPGRPSALMETTQGKVLRTEGFRYVCHADGRESLHDLGAPYAEYRDVAGDAGYAGALADARREMLRRLLENERPLARAWAY